MKIRQRCDETYELFDRLFDGEIIQYGIVNEEFLDEIVSEVHWKRLLDSNSEIEFEMVTRDK